MDIHPPGGQLHSMKDYLIHLSMVVLGILIALGLEGVRETWHEHELVDHSVEALREEVETNKALVAKASANYDESRHIIDDMTTLIQSMLKARESHGAVPPGNNTLNLNVGIPPLSSGAWQAALATQALSHMDYAQAQLWSSAYAFQNQIQLVQNDWISVYGRMSLLAHIDNDETDQQLRDQLALAQEVRQRIDMTLFVWRGLLERYDATLAATLPR